jgi:c(7)-type cytochrome triheme protein
VTVRFFPILFLALLVSFVGKGDAFADDRAELGRVMKTIPPNGPFWRYGNVVMSRKSRKAGMPPVVFAHWSHRANYTCRVCHLELEFAMHSGDTGISCEQNAAGRFCGACHNGGTAFTVRDGPAKQCAKCHVADRNLLEKEFDSFAADMPLAPFGNGIDWAEALRTGKIEPRKTILSAKLSMQFPEKLRATMKLGTSSPRSDVRFSHEDHFEELDCSSCHPELFNIKKKGTEKFTMEANIYGNFCGACHMRVAFPMNDCRRCHPMMSGFSGF